MLGKVTNSSTNGENEFQDYESMEYNQLGKSSAKVFKLQKRTHQASLSGQNAAPEAQKLLVKSYYAKLLAVRRVTHRTIKAREQP